MKKVFNFSLLILTLISLSTLVRPMPAEAADCGGPVPPKPMKVWAKSGSGGQVTLYWDAASHANRYAVAYGTMSNKYMYGADNIGGENARSYTVKSLMPGTKYYFRVAAANGCSSSPFSDEAIATAGSGAVMETAKATPVQVSKGGVGKQMLWAKAGPRVGEVTLYWVNNENAENYHLVYGTEHGKFKYGQLNIGKVNKYTVGKLVPGKEYYFAIVPVMNGQAMYTTPQVMATAYGGEVVVTSKENLVQPKPKTTVQTKPKTVTSQPDIKMMPKEASPSPVNTGVGTKAPESTPSGR